MQRFRCCSRSLRGNLDAKKPAKSTTNSRTVPRTLVVSAVWIASMPLPVGAGERWGSGRPRQSAVQRDCGAVSSLSQPISRKHAEQLPANRGDTPRHAARAQHVDTSTSTTQAEQARDLRSLWLRVELSRPLDFFGSTPLVTNLTL